MSQTTLASPKAGNRGREGGVALLHHENLLVWMRVQVRTTSRRGVYHHQRSKCDRAGAGLPAISLSATLGQKPEVDVALV